MRNINSLIVKHGSIMVLNGNKSKAFIDESKSSQLKIKTRLNPYVNTKTILTKQQISPDANIIIMNKNYKVFEVLNEVYHKTKLIYTETKLFEDTFINDISFHKQSIRKQGCNLPSNNDESYINTKAQITTKNHNDVLQYSMHTNKPVTHVFTILYVDGIRFKDLIKWGNRNFEILHVEDIDEKNRLLVIESIEVL